MTAPAARPRLPPLPERHKPERRKPNGRNPNGFNPNAGVDTPRRSPSMSPIVLIPVAAVGVSMVFLFVTLLDPFYLIAPANTLLTFLAVLTAAVAVAIRASHKETRFDLRSIMLTGFALRCVGAVVRFRQPVDAVVYHDEGMRLANEFRQFNVFPDVETDKLLGTGWLRYVSGIGHLITFDDMLATFLVFTFLAFIGTFLCYAAFVRAVPGGRHRRYALLIFLWPSLCYWPSSIGKEAWMILGIGIASWGVARALTGLAWSGVPVFALGLLTMAMVRPHVALMAVVGFGVALFVRPANRQTTTRIVGRVGMIALLLVGGSAVAAQLNEVLRTDSDGTELITTGLDKALAQTQQGGAAFSPTIVRTPLDYPLAFVTVWIRPFPTEARSGEGGPTQLASAIEGMVLVLLVLASWKQLRNLPRALVRISYVTYAFVYGLVFVVAFSAIGNFGILARQRTQGLVLFFVVLCLPDIIETATGGRQRALDVREQLPRPGERRPRAPRPTQVTST